MNAPTAARFCDILAKARALKLPNVWSGSAYRDHPCGVIRKGIIFANKWSTFNYCYASVLTEPHSAIIPGSKSPACMNCDPYPHPAIGEELQVYSTGNWLIEGPWQQVIMDVLDGLEIEIEQAELELEWNKKINAIDAKRKREENISDIRQRYISAYK